MTEDPQNLVLEHLRIIREGLGDINTRMDKMEQGITDLREDLSEVRHAVAGIAYAIAHQQGQFSERIERLEEKAGI